MLKNLCKNVLYIKDINSNVIEEAFFVLKDNDVKNIKMRNEIAMSEIDNIIDNMIIATKNDNLEKIKKNQKANIAPLIGIALIVISFIIMAITNL